MKKIISLWMCLILMTTLLSGIVFAAKDETESKTAETEAEEEKGPSVAIRAVYKASSDALSEENYYIYASCIAFPITAEGDTVYLIADAAMYDFNTIAAAAAQKIKPYFERSSIYGLKPSEYANEFKILGANIEAVIDEKTYSPRLLYASDSYAILVISDAPQMEIPSYTEESFEGTVKYQECVGDSFGIDTSEPQLETAIMEKIASMAYSGDKPELTKDISANSIGSPVMTTDGIICGFISCDSESGEAHVVKLSGLANKFKQLGIELTPVKTPTANGEGQKQADGSKNNAAFNEEEDERQKLVQTAAFRKVIIWATCIAGLLFIIVVILMILRTRNADKRAQAKAKRLRELAMSQSYAKPSAVTAPAHSDGSASTKKQSSSGASDNAPAHVQGHSPARVNLNKAEWNAVPSSSGKKTPAAEKPAPSAQSAKPADVSDLPKYMMLAVLEGQMKGFSINISESVIIGRDSKACQIVFPASQTEISRKHCRLTYRPDHGDLILEDLDSVNGTYTPDGRRYAAGRRYLLRSGDRFCIGSRENLIEVR